MDKSVGFCSGSFSAVEQPCDTVDFTYFCSKVLYKRNTKQKYQLNEQMLSLHCETSKMVVTARRRLRNIPVKVSKNKQRNVEEV